MSRVGIKQLLSADFILAFKQGLNAIRDASQMASRQGLGFVLLNIIATFCCVALVDMFAVRVESNSLLDEIVEAANATMHFLLFVLIAFIHIKSATKIKILIGFLLTQQGLMLDFLDEIYDLNSNWWHLIGDVVYFFGSICITAGAVQWVVYTYKYATLDPLTQVYNRRFFEQGLAAHLVRIQRNQAKATLVSLDLDNFKQINDKLGHDVGDDVLRLVSTILKQSIRRGDIVCRSGGEEFEILLADTNAKQAQIMAERIQADMREQTPPLIDTITASIGITEIRCSDSIESVRKRADSAMYSAKKSGKDKVVTAFH